MFSARSPLSAAGRLVGAVLLAACAMGAEAALAQENPPAAETPAAEAPAAAAPAAAAPAQPDAVPQPEWEKVCGTVNEAQECHISRRRLAATGQPLAQVMLIERPEKKLIQIAVPPIALIQPGVQIKIDDQEAVGVKYVVCTPSECLALGEINDEFIGKLKRGGTMIVSMLNPQGKAITFDISLAGFTASYDGPGIDPAEAQARQQKLEDELKRKADEARQQLLELQQQQQSANQGQ
jgi:invasion protein IalB